MFFPLTLAVSGLERHLGETGSSIASRFFAECSTRVEQPGQCVTFFNCIYFICFGISLEYPTSNVILV